MSGDRRQKAGMGGQAPLKLILLLVSAGVSVLLVYGFVAVFLVQQSHVTIHDPDLGRVLQGKTLVHLSDLHMSSLGIVERKVLKTVKELKPDILVLTGDYVAWNRDVKPALDFLSGLRAELGVFAVLGDYDRSNSRQSCQFCHKRGSGEKTDVHQVQMLKNSALTVQVNGEPLMILGVDGGDGDEDAPEKLKQLFSGKQPAIVLCHDPLRFDEFTKEDHFLMLAGDTHGGQIPLPSAVWNGLGYVKNAKYNQGLFKEGGKTMYVSRGIGTSHVPFRLFRAPEIVVYHFKS